MPPLSALRLPPRSRCARDAPCSNTRTQRSPKASVISRYLALSPTVPNRSETQTPSTRPPPPALASLTSTFRPLLVPRCCAHLFRTQNTKSEHFGVKTAESSVHTHRRPYKSTPHCGCEGVPLDTHPESFLRRSENEGDTSVRTLCQLPQGPGLVDEV